MKRPRYRAEKGAARDIRLAIGKRAGRHNATQQPNCKAAGPGSAARTSSHVTKVSLMTSNDKRAGGRIADECMFERIDPSSVTMTNTERLGG